MSTHHESHRWSARAHRSLPKRLAIVVSSLIVAACGASVGGQASLTAPASMPSTAVPSMAAASTAPVISPAPVATAGAPTDDPSVAWIMFQGPDGLTRVRPDGSGQLPALPDGPTKALHADWSPDGTRFAFVVDQADETRDLWIAGWDGSHAEQLIDCSSPCRDNDTPAWSPDGTRIAFTRIDNINGHNPGSKLQLIDVATRKITTLATTKGAEYAIGPRWSPDGRSIVVQVDRYIDDGNATDTKTGESIGVVHLDDPTPAIKPITSFEDFGTYPDWHPTQDLILFAEGTVDPLDPQGKPENLFTIRPDGTGRTQLTDRGPDDLIWMPAYRPDGSGILVTLTQRPTGSLSLATLAVDGTGLTQLGDQAPIAGAHTRQRPMPSTP